MKHCDINENGEGILSVISDPDCKYWHSDYKLYGFTEDELQYIRKTQDEYDNCQKLIEDRKKSSLYIKLIDLFPERYDENKINIEYSRYYIRTTKK